MIKYPNLDFPKAVSSPWFREDPRTALTVVFIYLLRIPLEIAHKFGIGEVVHDPVPQWTAPSLIFQFFALKITGHHMSSKLDK